MRVVLVTNILMSALIPRAGMSPQRLPTVLSSKTKWSGASRDKSIGKAGIGRRSS
jgi:hypothetical protein